MTSHSDKLQGLTWVLLAFGLLLLSAIAWPEPGWLKSDFQALLPAGGNDRWVEGASRQAASAYETQLVVLVEGEDVSRTKEFFESVRDELITQGLIVANFNEVEAGKWRALGKELYPYRWNLLTASDYLALERDAPSFLENFRKKIYTPLGGVLAETLPTDPMGTFRKYLQAAIPISASSTIDQLPETVQFGVFTIPQGMRSLDSKSNMYSAYSRLKERAAEDGMALYATGVPLYSSYGAQSAKQEISTIGVVSLVLLVGLQVAFLRSIAAIGLTLISVATGVAGGVVITVLVMRELHILTLVFGTTIIGIAVDYSYHYLAHSLLPGWRREKALSRVFTSLGLGVLSSVVAFFALTFMPFPGIRQIGLFMAAGLLCSFLTVCLLYPLLYRGPPVGAQLPPLFRGSRLTLRSLRAPLLIVLMAIPGWLLLTPLDEVRTFYGKPPVLGEDEEVIVERMSVASDSRYFLVRGSNPEVVLETEERLSRLADTLSQDAEVLELHGVSNVVPSSVAQRRNFDLVRRVLESGELAEHLDNLGFKRAYRDEVLNSIPAVFEPLQLTDLDRISLPSGMGGFIGCQEAECASWVSISSRGAADSLSHLLRGNPSVTYVDPIGDINSLLADYRKGVMIAMAGGVVSILAILCLFYGWRRAVPLLLLPVAACLLTIAAIGYLRGSYTIINLLALLLIFGVSMDYSIFRGLSSPADQPAVTFAISLSALTSVVAFGMLAFSQTPLISTFGETIAIGLSVAFALSWLRVEWRR
ncbi:MAG: MMPL family transporter [Halioglobus sp.]|nr:MMPL family transporter [Halioglobus sp.]